MERVVLEVLVRVRRGDQQDAVGPEDPGELVQRALGLRDVLDALEGDYEVELAAVEAKLGEIGHAEVEAVAAAGVLDDLGVDIDPADVRRTRGGQDRRAITLAARGVQHAPPFRDPGRQAVAREVLGEDQFAGVGLGDESFTCRLQRQVPELREPLPGAPPRRRAWFAGIAASVTRAVLAAVWSACCRCHQPPSLALSKGPDRGWPLAQTMTSC